MRSSEKEIQEILNESGQPIIVVSEKEDGLTSRQKKILEKTMHRHDEAFKRLAEM